MESPLVKALIEQGRKVYYPKAKLWPNGLGFDYRGWAWGFDERPETSQIKRWVCTKTRNGKTVLGRGANPFDAYAHAVPLKEQG